MQTRTAFGLRAGALAPTPRNAAIAKPAHYPAAPSPTFPAVEGPAADPSEPTLDEEMRAWKEARGSKFQMPWRQLALMASLCFGIASFVLPDSISGDLDWLLWGLMGASAYVGFRKRREKRAS
ncbi:MAG TPA: hypothetical protein VHC42_12165 [Rhizomicrobium sp.]|nr:hypothetical protein [Rhizomicrobium sp.]